MKQGRSKLTVHFKAFTNYERFNNETDELFLHCPEEKRIDLNSTGSLTALEAAWNVTNAIQVEYLVFYFKLEKYVCCFRECF
jgi:hypothetical protein